MPQPDLVSPAVAGQVIVRLKPAFGSLPDEVLEARLGGSIVKRMPELDSVLLRIEPEETVAAAVGRLADLPQVELAEPNHRFQTTIVPNDPFYSAQSGYLGLIQAPAAWDIELGEDSVLVAVLDSGIDLEHPDLQARYWTNLAEVDGNGRDEDNNGCVDDSHGCNFVSPASADPACSTTTQGGISDDNGHGTFISGIIAAQANNSLGVSGAAPGVKILPVKILDCVGGGTAVDAAQGLLYAAKMGARVANISFGADGESLTLANAVREAYTRYGVVVVAATGNEGRNVVTFPARLPETIAVASSGTPENLNARSPFSNWGPEVSFAAPGLNIVSTIPKAFCSNGAWLCVQDEPYAVASGTSFAAPLVSALAALLISHTPNLPPEAVRRIIASTAEPLPGGGSPPWYGAGRIRMRAALNQPRYYLGAAGITRQ